MSAMVVDEDHYVDVIFHDAGSYGLSPDRSGTRYVVIAVRTLVDPYRTRAPMSVGGARLGSCRRSTVTTVHSSR